MYNMHTITIDCVNSEYKEMLIKKSLTFNISPYQVLIPTIDQQRVWAYWNYSQECNDVHDMFMKLV